MDCLTWDTDPEQYVCVILFVSFFLFGVGVGIFVCLFCFVFDDSRLRRTHRDKKPLWAG